MWEGRGRPWTRAQKQDAEGQGLRQPRCLGVAHSLQWREGRDSDQVVRAFVYKMIKNLFYRQEAVQGFKKGGNSTGFVLQKNPLLKTMWRISWGGKTTERLLH